MPSFWLLLAIGGALSGFTFAAISTYDFVAHLDRQVHGLHCSLLPGIGTPDVSGASGCHVTLMSPYSSVLRDSVWGGIPISLPAMAVFAFLAFWGGYLWITRRTEERTATGFYALACGLPALSSLVMGAISLSALSALCKVCLGIYLSSALCLTGSLGLFRKAGAQPGARGTSENEPLSAAALALAFALGVFFVGSAVVAYAASAPSFDSYVGRCGKLEQPADPRHVLLSLGGEAGGVDVVEVLDPLCPACRAFEQRFEKISDVSHTVRRALLFPLDNTCNWMVDSAVHPGACAISEAMLCADQKAMEVLSWAFDEQEEIVARERAQPGSAARMATQRFPELSGCVGGSKVKARLNRALRWAVDNKMPVLTPQLYVNGTRLCDADTDLGLDYMLSRLMSQEAPARR